MISLKPLFFSCLGVALTATGCSSLNSTAIISREILYQPTNSTIPGTLYSVSSDATRRVGFVFVTNEGKMKALLEPPPDAVAAAVSNLSAKASISKTEVGVTNELKKTNDLLAARGTAVELQRGQLFQLSLLYFSDGIEQKDVKAEFDKIIDSSNKLALAEATANMVTTASTAAATTTSRSTTSTTTQQATATQPASTTANSVSSVTQPTPSQTTPDVTPNVSSSATTPNVPAKTQTAQTSSTSAESKSTIEALQTIMENYLQVRRKPKCKELLQS